MQRSREQCVSRSDFIKAMIGAAFVMPLGARAQAERLLSVEHPLVPVKVSPSRVIRTMVGLRPFRPQGFVLKAEPFGNKTLVHNYGHGGGGISLSWGCATLAADLINGKSPARAAVIGAGAIGLSTARILQDRGWEVTIYTEHLPPNTTSNVAGAQWSPSSVCDHDAIAADFPPLLVKSARIANRAFQLLVGTNYGVRWIDNYCLEDDPDKEIDTVDYATRLGIADLFADLQTIDPASTPFVSKHVRRFATMLIEPNTYLPAVMRDFLLRSGKIVVRKFEHQSDWHKLHEHVIFNCTGLGARTLVEDSALIPVRGQLTILEPQPEVNYIMQRDGLYMFPRADGIVLGGTYDRGNWSLDPDLKTQERIISQHAAIYRS
jgi:D-amino-acid oxidase